MAKNNDTKNVEKISTILGDETILKGVLRFSDSLKIGGIFEGNIIATGFLYIENGAVVNAGIKVRSIVVGGIVTGNIEASEKLEILATGQVYGNIKTAVLRIADGVIFEGKCEMIKENSDIDVFSSTVESFKEKCKP